MGLRYITTDVEGPGLWPRGHRGGGMVMFAMAAAESAPSAGPEPVEVQSGKATVNVTLSASYRRRTAFDGAAKSPSRSASSGGGAKTARATSASNGS